MHPGAGSTNVLFEGCGGTNNKRAGLFFCVRANHISVRQCDFKENGLGISIGTRDCHNLIEQCRIEHNDGPGLLLRSTPRPTEAHGIMVRDCLIRANASKEGRGQVELTGDAHELVFSGNQLDGSAATAGIIVDTTVLGVYLVNNQFSACSTEIVAAESSLVERPPVINYGYGQADEIAFRHLPKAN